MTKIGLEIHRVDILLHKVDHKDQGHEKRYDGPKVVDSMNYLDSYFMRAGSIR